MASIAFNSRVTFSQVYTEGITKISADDIRYAKEFGYVIKLLGVARNVDGQIEVKVHPMLMPYLYMVMRWTMLCLWDAEPVRCKQQVPLWVT